MKLLSRDGIFLGIYDTILSIDTQLKIKNHLEIAKQSYESGLINKEHYRDLIQHIIDEFSCSAKNRGSDDV